MLASQTPKNIALCSAGSSTSVPKVRSSKRTSRINIRPLCTYIHMCGHIHANFHTYKHSTHSYTIRTDKKWGKLLIKWKKPYLRGKLWFHVSPELGLFHSPQTKTIFSQLTVQRENHLDCTGLASYRAAWDRTLLVPSAPRAGTVPEPSDTKPACRKLVCQKCIHSKDHWLTGS